MYLHMNYQRKHYLLFPKMKLLPYAHIKCLIFPSKQTSCYWEEGRKKKQSTNTKSNCSPVQPVTESLAWSRELILWMGKWETHTCTCSQWTWPVLQSYKYLWTTAPKKVILCPLRLSPIFPQAVYARKNLSDVNQIEWCFLPAKDLLLGFVQ